MSQVIHVADAPLVTILMASHNHEAFVAEALESAIAQDHPNLQIVIADDASSDRTRDITRDYAARYPQLIKPVLNREHLGVAGNFNSALEHCTGKYVCFLGADDLYLPGKISRQVEWFEERPERVLCGHQVEVFYEDGSRPHRFQRRLRQGRGARPIVRYGAFAACSIMVRADRIPSYGFDERLSLVSDYKFFVDVVGEDGEFGYIPGTYARYRRHGSNASANAPAMIADVARALALVEGQFPQFARECRGMAARLVQFQRGQLRLAQGDRSAARRDFLKAIREEPTFVRPWIALMKTLGPG